jgi:hypothetical protein
MRPFWKRWIEGRRADAEERAIEERGMSRSEREFIHESVEDHEADAESSAHLGGVDPKRLLGD